MKNCNCGNKLPYRRAYSCRACWDKLGTNVQGSLMRSRMTKHDGAGTLSLRSVDTKARG